MYFLFEAGGFMLKWDNFEAILDEKVIKSWEKCLY